ncbi:MAG TPA: hypothetical protein VKK79_02865 [Candidatus Lokiarchaeia archaeon]|nr:hypothetical protein [Candidatus Lokiarchaeia archaeon]
MGIKTVCIFQGIPLWSSSYPEEKLDYFLISGFFSALNTFAKETEGTTIKNITIGNQHWTFSNIYGMDGFFLAVCTELLDERPLSKEEIKIFENLIIDLLQEFSKLFPEEYFKGRKVPTDMEIFDGIKSYSLRKVKNTFNLLQRKTLYDPVWLAQISGCENLFSALLNRKDIYVLTENPSDLLDDPEFVKFHATLEAFNSFKPLTAEIINILDPESEREQKPKGSCIYLSENSSPITVSMLDGTVFDFQLKKVLKGSYASSFMEEIVQYLRAVSFERGQILFDRLNEIRGTPTKMEEELEEKNQLIEGSDVDFKNKPNEIPCKLCGTPIRFRINDESSYLDKSSNKKYFGMSLSTYKIAHIADDDLHVCKVLIDQGGGFNSYVDAYSTSLMATPGRIGTKSKNFRIISGGEFPLSQNNVFEMFFEFNRKENWILDIIRPPDINAIELINSITELLQQNEKIYSHLPEMLTFNIAGKIFHLWIKNSIILVVCYMREECCGVFNLLAEKIVETIQNEEDFLSRSERFKLFFTAIDKMEMTQENVSSLLRLIFDDLFYSYIHLKFKNILPRLLDRIKREFAISTEFLLPLLNGQKSLLETLDATNTQNYIEIMNVIDFINRRNLVS